jgi:acyl-CoA thioesterase-2
MAPVKEALGDWYDRPRPIDVRYVDPVAFEGSRPRATEQIVWFRADGELREDPVLHACIVTYASDMTLLDTTLLPHGMGWGTRGIQMASLDHAMWFHRPFRADEWLLYVETSPTTSDARGLAGGHMFTRAGELVVSVVQEGLIRVDR